MATWSCEDSCKITDIGTSIEKKELMIESCKLVVWTRDSLLTLVRMMELMLLVRTMRKDPLAARILVMMR
jgi:hypothetical protein